MVATYSAALAVIAASIVLGQAALGLCGIRRWSWLSPAVGLALLCGLCWGTVRLPGDGALSAALVFALVVAGAVFLAGRARGVAEAPWAAVLVALVAVAAASLPFAAEGHFGILGTGFNPDMSQHLLAADRLAEGAPSQLLDQGYPLGPHAIVVALEKGLGVGLVQGFDGLTIAVAALAALTGLAAFAEQRLLPRSAAALVLGLPYLVASYYAQGAFKETMQALFLLAFVLSLREASRNPAWRDLRLRFVPAALLAVGSVYTYSFPGLIWLAGAALAWVTAEWAWTRFEIPAGGEAGGKLPAWSLALIVFAVGALPELGRMIDFHSFETFNPNGPGLGNLFGQISPFTALGIWPSGDFRLAPGDGAAPAVAYYLGAAFSTALLIYGLAAAVRRREGALLAGAVTVTVVYLAARAGGTPYTAAKALEIAAPVLTLVILAPLLTDRDRWFLGTRRDKAAAQGKGKVLMAAAAIYLLAAGFCSLLAFANAPIGPTSYSPALTGLRPLVAEDSTLVLAPRRLLEEEQGMRYIAWELRGGRVCIAASEEADRTPPPAVRFVVTWAAEGRPPYTGLTLRRKADPYLLWEVSRPTPGHSPCPLIAVRQARHGPQP